MKYKKKRNPKHEDLLCLGTPLKFIYLFNMKLIENNHMKIIICKI